MRTVYVCSASSDGHIRLFNLADVPETLGEGADPATIECISSFDTKGTRLTCIRFADAEDATTLGKRRRPNDSDSDEEEAVAVDAKKARPDSDSDS